MGGTVGADMGFTGLGFGSGGGGCVPPARFCQRKRQYTAPYSGRFQLRVLYAILKNRVLINGASL